MINDKKILVVIPARGGSKGIPLKNIKPLGEKPLIYYSIDIAREITSDDNICVSTDSEKIIEVVNKYGLEVPFIRPKNLATDSATTNDVILHAINFYETLGRSYDIILLLQPTSPFRNKQQIKEALSLFSEDFDMVVSVKQSHAVSTLCVENDRGFLEVCFNKEHLGRQDFEKYYEYNGAIYILNVNKFKEKGFTGLTKKKKYIMDQITSLDIDTYLDWIIAECIIRNCLDN